MNILHKKKLLFGLFLMALLSAKSTAQTATDSIQKTINLFFDGMRQRDTALMRSALSPSVVFQTIAKNAQGEAIVRTENVENFLKNIVQLNDTLKLDERIAFETIKIDGTLASVWTPYEFFINNKRRHCGVNSFQVVRLNDKWRIQYIIDTRRVVGCP